MLKKIIINLLVISALATPASALVDFGIVINNDIQAPCLSWSESNSDVIKLAWNWNAAQQMHHTVLAIEMIEHGYEVAVNYRSYNDMTVQSWVSVNRIFSAVIFKPFIGVNLFNTATWAVNAGVYVPLITTDEV